MLLVERGGDGPGHWTQLLALIGSPEEVRLPARPVLAAILVGVVCGGRSLGAGPNAVGGVEDKGWWLEVRGKR